MEGEWIIIGDTDKHKDCLVCRCGTDEKYAASVLNRITNYPTEDDLLMINEHTNLRIKFSENKDCWWKVYGTD